MNGKKKIFLGMGIAFGAVALALGGYGLSFVGQRDETPPYAEKDYGEWVVTKEPTCEEKGQKMRALLSLPAVTQTVEIPALGHEWGEWEETTAPTCMTDGVNQRECALCHNYDFAPIPALGHEWGEWETTRAATCLTAGYDTRVCTHDAAHTDLRTVEALGHDWSDWVTVTAPTCTVTGIEQSTCRNDKYHVQQRTVDALGHDWNDPVVTKAATCLSNGTLSKICRNDKLHTESEPIPALGHDWSEWVVTKAPTEFENGTEMRVCANNSLDKETRSIPFLGNAGLSYRFNADETGYIVSWDGFFSGKELYIPQKHNGLSVTEIGESAFQASSSLTKVVFGGSIEKIGARAFRLCTQLEYLGIPSSVKEIGVGAFEGMSVKSFQIPASVTKVGTGAFDGWTEEQTVYVMGFASQEAADAAWGATWRNGCNANIVYETGEEDEYSEKLSFSLHSNGAAYQVRARNHDITSVTIPATYKGLPVTRIADNAFINCEGLTSVVILGNNLEYIGRIAFAKCNFESIVIPESVTQIGSRAFCRNTALKTIAIPEGVKKIGPYAFGYCEGLESVSLPASLTEIEGGGSLFVQCPALKTITVAEGNEVFRSENNCLIERATNTLLAGTTTSVIPANVTAIGEYAFAHRAMESILIPASVTVIGDYSFQYSKITSIIIPSSVTEIGSRVFCGCSELKEVIFEGNEITIGRQEFMNCLGISRLELPANVTAVGVQAFYGWTEAQTIVIKGFASEEEATAAWGADWLKNCNATIVYEKENSETI